MVIRLFFLFLVLFILSCGTNQSSDTNFKAIKYLEYTRNSDIDTWKKLDKPQNRNQLILSIGKTRNASLLPLLTKYLSENSNDSVLCSAMFGIGEIGTESAVETLLKYPVNQQSISVKVCDINALALNPSDEILKYFVQLMVDTDLKPTIITASGILAKNQINTSSVKYAVLDSFVIAKPTVELSYYLSNAGDLSDASDMIKMLLNSKSSTQKNLLKALSRLYKTQGNKFTYQVHSDSLSNNILYTVISGVINSNSDWTNKYYALQLVPVVSDSMLNLDVLKLCSSKQVPIKLTALKALAKSGAAESLSTLLLALEKERQNYSKGTIIKILAQYFPNKAYPFIMQNLDKGDRIYKSELLEALAILNTKLSIRTLRQFLNVDDPLLVNTAFEQLDNLHIIKTNEIETLLQSDNFSTIASVLNYFVRHHKTTDTKTLMDLYKKFKYPSEFEVQFAVIDLLEKAGTSSDSLIFSDLINHACHDVVLKRIKERFKGLNLPVVNELEPGFQLSQHLQPDSIRYYQDNPAFEIVTNKGSINIELFSRIAPFTVYSFIRLIDMNFYNNLTFHRVVPDFVIQGGDPMGDGWGGPNYFIPSEHSKVPFTRGTIGIATSGFDTGSSQFFICQSDQPHLNGKYTLFGKVTSGMDVVDSILPGDTITSIKPLE